MTQPGDVAGAHRTPAGAPWRPRSSDVFGIAAVLAAALAFFGVVLSHGIYLGPYYLISHASGLTAQPHVHVPVRGNSDIVAQMLPWASLAWNEVHHGHLPLWDPYSVLGTPLAFNWQSAPFSLPALVGYLVPSSDAATVGALVSVVVAGTGGYVLGRTLSMGVAAATALGITWELSGPVVAWLGFPFPAVLCWMGWIVAFGLLLVRSRRPGWWRAATAASVCLALLGGQPEGFSALALAVAVFFLVVIVETTPTWSSRLRSVGRLAVAVIAGGALSAPFSLPSLQLTTGSIRSAAHPSAALPAHVTAYLVFQGFDGLPTPSAFLPDGLSSVFYTEFAAYVGISVLVLAGVAVWVHRRRPHVQGLVLAATACLLASFVEPVTRTLDRLPLVGSVAWGSNPLMPLALCLAALAADGLDVVVRSGTVRTSGRALLTAFGTGAVALGAIWLVARGHLTPAELRVRDHAFVWPTIEVAAGLTAGALALVVSRWTRPARGAARRDARVRWSIAAVLVGSQTAFLVAAGAPLVQSSNTRYPHPAAVRQLVDAVGTSTVGFGPSLCDLGISVDTNVAYRVRELAAYDDSLPTSLFSSWQRDTGSSAGFPGFYVFCPVVPRASVARTFGISYLLEGPGHTGPPGTRFVRSLGDESLWKVSGAGEATLTTARAADGPPVSRVVPVADNGAGTWRLTVAPATPATLDLHIIRVPGLHATLDGRPLAMHPLDGVMLQARVPAGRHRIVVRYWPSTLTDGLVLALVALVALVLAAAGAGVGRRRRPARAAPGDPPGTSCVRGDEPASIGAAPELR